MAVSMSMAVFSTEAETGRSPDNMKEFLIGSWLSYYDTGITGYREQTEDLARSGINMTCNPDWLGSQDFTTQGIPLEDLPALDALYAENNMYYIAKHGDPQALVSTVLDNGLNNCWAYYVKDEPAAAEFGAVSQTMKRYLELDPNRFPFATLFPNYAGTTNLGGTYEDYVRNWVSMVGAENLEYLSFDHYPFTSTEDVRASFFSDLETIRKVAFENGRIKTEGCTQLGWWQGMRRPTMNEARWDTYALVAYGMKSIIHFNWVSPSYVAPEDGGEGMRDFVLTNDGRKTELYEPMQRLNWQVRQLGPLLMELDAQHAYHTGNIPDGAEELPKSFAVQPVNRSDDLILTVFVNEDNSQTYLGVFNKSLTESKTASFSVNPDSGVEFLTYYRLDDFETLPDPAQPLPAPAEERVNLMEGLFTDTFLAGEMKLYKLEGDSLNLPEPLSVPQASLKSGIHVGQQSVEITTPDQDAEIYYTLDGSYPTRNSTRYTGRISIGKDHEISRHILRMVAIRGEEVTKMAEYDYFITDDSENVAYQKPVTIDGEWVPVNCTDGVPGTLNDGVNDPWHAVGTRNGTTGWATIDFGAEYMINRVYQSAWGNWAFRDVIIQLSTTPDFTPESTYTVYNNDHDNSEGYGAGINEAYVEAGNYAGHTFEFEPVPARYIRSRNLSVQNETERHSIWTEIMAFTAYEGGRSLGESENSWQTSGGGTWSLVDGVFTQEEAYNGSQWNRSFTYTAQKFKNFMIEGVFEVQNYEASQNGYLGFGLYKPSPTTTQDNPDMGYYIGVEPKGRVFAYRGSGAGEIGPRNVEAIGFSYNDSFRLRVVSVGDTIAVYVGDKQVYYHRDPLFDREAGYISIQCGPFALKVSDLTVTELPDEGFLYEGAEQIVSTVINPERIALEKYTSFDEVLKLLPQKIEIEDSAQKKHVVDVVWSMNDYDRTTTGWYTAVGTLINLPENVNNLFDVKATASLFIKAELDKEAFHALIAEAEEKVESDYTADSWANFALKLQAAKELDADPFMVQNDIGVTHFQLFDAMKALVSQADRTSLEAAVKAAEAVEGKEYTASSYEALQTVLDQAQSVLNASASLQDEIDRATEDLTAAYGALTKLADKTLLESIVAEAKTVDTSGMNQASRKALEAAIEYGEYLIAEEEARESEVAEAVDLIRKAREDAEGPASKGALNALIGEYQGIAGSDYTELSYGILQEALRTAGRIQSDESASQTAVDLAVKLLSEAKEGLVPKRAAQESGEGCNRSASTALAIAAILSFVLVGRKR